MYGRISGPGMGPYLPRVALALRTPGYFRTVRGGIDPGNHRFRPRFVVDLRKNLIRAWDFILPGWRWLYECEPQVGGSTLCGALSTRGTIVFVLGFLEL